MYRTRIHDAGRLIYLWLVSYFHANREYFKRYIYTVKPLNSADTPGRRNFVRYSKGEGKCLNFIRSFVQSMDSGGDLFSLFLYRWSRNGQIFFPNLAEPNQKKTSLSITPRLRISLLSFIYARRFGFQPTRCKCRLYLTRFPRSGFLPLEPFLRVHVQLLRFRCF